MTDPLKSASKSILKTGLLLRLLTLELRHLQQLEDAGLRQPDIEDDIDTPHTATFGSRV